MRMRAILIGGFVYGLLFALLPWLILAAASEARPYADPAWNAAPAWTITVPAHGQAEIPNGVCPFGFSDLAAYRGTVRLDRYVSFDANRTHALIFNNYRRTVRAYVWCG